MFKQLLKITLVTNLFFLGFSAHAALVPPKLFDLSLVPHQDNAEYWTQPEGTQANEWLMSECSQKAQFKRMQENWFAPWNADTLRKQITREGYPKVLASIVRGYRNEINEGEALSDKRDPMFPVIQTNFRPFDNAWLDKIVANANYPQFDSLEYNKNNRAIITHNAFVRVFPTHDTYYRRHKHSGNINPFDRLQMSVIWAGTPIYILGSTKDKAWHYIYTKSYSGWVLAKDVAQVDDDFVLNWQHTDDDLIAIVQNNVSLNKQDNNQYITQAGIGAVFPGQQDGSTVTVKAAVADQHGDAHITTAFIDNTEKPLAMVMPIPPTRENFAYVMQDMVSKPYAWGGSCFFNDCSQELKNIYAPFGIWLARNSKMQVEGVKTAKLDHMKTMNERINHLREHGKPFMTLVYIGGHIMMYVGEDANNMPTLYQNMWFLRGKDRNREQYVVGQSLFLPADVKNSNTYSMVHPDIAWYYWLANLDEPL